MRKGQRITAPRLRVRIRFVPAPAGHDFRPAIDALEAIGRRVATATRSA